MRRELKFKRLVQYSILILLTMYFSMGIVNSTFAIRQDKGPEVIVNIGSNGSMTQDGTLFEGSLFPSTVPDAENGIGSIKGVIRLVNDYQNIDIDNISIGLNLTEMDIRNNYPWDQVYNSFLDKIRLKIEKGRALNFNKIIVDYTSLRNLLFDDNNGDYQGYNLVDGNKFSLNKGDYIDLKYTLQMVECAGNELQSVTAYMPIYINLQGNHGGNGGDGGDGGGVIPPIKVPVVIDGEEIVFEELIPEGEPQPEDEEIVIEEDLELNEEIPEVIPSTGLPRTGSANPLINVGLGAILLGLGSFLKKKELG